MKQTKKTWFTADWHLGDAPDQRGVCNRPFASQIEMSNHLIQTCNETVPRNGRLVIIGDFASHRCSKWRQQIHCKDCILVLGNHDVPLVQAQNAFGKYKVHTRYECKINGNFTVCNHYFEPYCNKSHYKSYMLYGHTHDMREATLDALFPGRRSTDVGVDTAKRILGEYRPFEDTEVDALLAMQPGSDDLAFYKALRGEYVKESGPAISYNGLVQIEDADGVCEWVDFESRRVITSCS